MRQLTKSEIDKLELLSQNSLEVALIEPTATGLKKSILDATASFRTYLKAKGFHDYAIQGQGPLHKVLLPAHFIESNGLKKTTTSLYRPKTKKGDPRIWFRGLGAYAAANDILAAFECNNELYILNLTTLPIAYMISEHSGSPLFDIVHQINSDANLIASELLGLLTKIAQKGLIPSEVRADTAIGRTLERELGIPINSSKKPDYKGIELKSFRDRRNNRKNLFTQVPNWKLSKFKSSREILDAFGYQRDGVFSLYCTVSCITTNSQGLSLHVDSEIQQLLEKSDKATIKDFVVWELEKLHKRLLEKHSETFWVTAESIFVNDKEHFKFYEVEHTKRPIVSQFDILLEQGLITLDHLIKRKANGQIVEKGPSFKLKANALNLLFPKSEKHSLI